MKQSNVLTLKERKEVEQSRRGAIFHALECELVLHSGRNPHLFVTFESAFFPEYRVKVSWKKKRKRSKSDS